MKSSPSRRLILALRRPARVPNTLPSRAVSCSAARHHRQRKAGKRAALQNGGDTRRQGTVVTRLPVSADDGDTSDMASVQDTVRFESNSRGGSIGLTPGMASVSIDQQVSGSDNASVQQRSGLRAGYASFQIKVKAELEAGLETELDAELGAEGKVSFCTGVLTSTDTAPEKFSATD